ncbi:hypothetical protein GLOIN_2v1834755 [Rhizophagus clarus]|uniref:Galactose oxidase n=1 Tax=Rhizophagus clarus TaxID=94130 RepID=A0A8H3QB52_9GLOM|nr:hypothetical protein GLOIN_2v1834755 [Rhizophagus clarus]
MLKLLNIMTKNSLVNFFILWILLHALVEVNCQVVPFEPDVVYRHTATYIDNKLYILGGIIPSSGTRVNEFFSLDFSVPFDTTQKLPWQDLSSIINMIPPHDSATSAKGGANNDTLILYGGKSTDPTMASVYIFDPQHVTWKVQTITGINTIKVWDLTGVIDNENFYLFGGNTPDVPPNEFLNDMFILDTINFSLGRYSLVNAPTPRCNYGATLLLNNKILYIGGNDDPTTDFNSALDITTGTALPLNEVYIYDTINNIWDKEATTGQIPSNRAGFSTVLGLDGQRVIIYGGIFVNPGYSDTTLYVLNLTNYNWYVPIISGTMLPKPRFQHKANVIGKYMVISFGDGYDRTVDPDILLLDISNNDEYFWTTKFDPSAPLPSTTLPSSPNSSSIPSPTSSQSPSSTPSSSSSKKLVGGIVGTLLIGISLSVGGFFIYKWNKKRQNKNIINENNSYYGQEEKELPTERNIHDYGNATNNKGHETIQIMNDNTTNYDHGQEIVLSPKNENTTNHEPANDHHDQEIMQTLKNENKFTHEQIIPAPAVVYDNYNSGQGAISTSNNNGRSSSQILKDEILQTIRQEFGQNLKDEILQAVREGSFNNLNTTKNNARQD